MKKVIRILLKGIGLLMILLLVFIGISFVNHKIKLSRARDKYISPGKMVEVNNHNMHVYAEGNGEATLVFMPGAGSTCPTLDLKPIWSKFTSDYRIAVVDKPGSGWSESTDMPRDIKTIVDETREALEKSGEKGPYVLLPHSISGLEAIYWAQNYGDEVKGIIGLDPAIPEVYEGMPEIPNAIFTLSRMLQETGVIRFMPNGKDSEILKLGLLSKEEEEIFLEKYYENSFSKSMVDENMETPKNIELVKRGGVPKNIPAYFFISNREAFVEGVWKRELINYTEKTEGGRYMNIDSGHAVYYYEPDLIAEESKKFLKDVLK